MVDELLGTGICTGCSACANICPVKCIDMSADEHGFLYPQINHELCIQCGACDKVCQEGLKKRVEDSIPLAYAAYAKDYMSRMSSSSGGLFGLLAEAVLESGGVVAGAAMSDDGYYIEHVLIAKAEQLSMLRGSKYVQSRLNDSFSKIKEFLKDGKKVLFSGTPCQVDGLKAFLDKDYENLLCVDTVCHGVPSEMIWKKYCKEVEKSTGSKITRVNFRHKKYSWERLKESMAHEGGRTIYRAKKQDPYLRLFLKNYGLRPSCYNCCHKGLNRNSDITLADFWGIGKVVPSFSDGKGVSLVLVHSQKGKDIISAISDKIVTSEANAVKAMDGNISGLESADSPKRLAEFWNNYEKMSVEDLANKYAPIGTKERIKLKITKMPVYGMLSKRLRRKKPNMEYGILFVLRS